ncbi:nitric oxide reductase transcriptional regulator NorR [Lonsdalea quercina]|uniref:nitric oxide reductase transcriptional regulator NorR n=1 Tax=Lonsdalea quercina TaxID=71657 RepID=UPI003975DC45
MTQILKLLNALVPQVADLSREMPCEVRYQRLLDSLNRLIPADASALLQLEGEELTPVAIQGLHEDALKRRFILDENPRFAAMLATANVMRFPPDTGVPDPFVGLFETEECSAGKTDVLGCALRLDQHIWGLLTLHAFDGHEFSADALKTLEIFGEIASATLSASTQVDRLKSTLQSENLRAEAFRLTAVNGHDELIGSSEPFELLMDDIELVASSDMTVLITGETGVGKDLVARRLHARSRRANAPFIVINCAALPPPLLESVLFGHVRGAFSGDSSDRRGKFQLASGGTLFLDEIGELSQETQAKLLSVLQDGKSQRIGSSNPHNVNIRLIAATNRNLFAEVQSGEFRADLYHRLCAFPIHVPALRERQQDIQLLANTFVAQNRNRMGLKGLRLSPSAQTALSRYAWPGNVRELEQTISRATLRATGRLTASPAKRAMSVTISDQDLGLDMHEKLQHDVAANEPQQFAPKEAPQQDLRSAVNAFQKQLIERTLHNHHGNISAAAQELGIDPDNLTHLAYRLGVATEPEKAVRTSNSDR